MVRVAGDRHLGIPFAIQPLHQLFDEGEKKGYKFWKSNPGKLFTAAEMIEELDRELAQKASWIVTELEERPGVCDPDATRSFPRMRSART